MAERLKAVVLKTTEPETVPQVRILPPPPFPPVHASGAAVPKHRSSQAAWTEGEALERRGNRVAALKLFVKAALAEEDDLSPMRARVLWERIAERTGPTAMLLERLASTSEKAGLAEEALAYWLATAAAARHANDTETAGRADSHLERLASAGSRLPVELPPLAAQALDAHGTLVQAQLARLR